MRGGPGTITGVVRVSRPDGGPMPTAFVAVTVTEYSVRMTRPVVVPAQSSVTVDFGAKVVALDEGNIARLELTAVFDGQTVLGQARAAVLLA